MSRIARSALEVKILTELSYSKTGLALGELRAKFGGEVLTHTLDHLVDRGQVIEYDGLVYGIADLGRSRLAPPVCVVS